MERGFLSDDILLGRGFMPHCIIECSSKLSDLISFDVLVREVHDITESSNLFSKGAVKARIALSNYYIVGGDTDNFINVIVNIFPGRTIQQRKSLSMGITDRLCNILPTVKAISVEVREIEKNTHSNRLSIEKNKITYE